MTFYVIQFEGAGCPLAGAPTLEKLKEETIKYLRDDSWERTGYLNIYEFNDEVEPEFRGDLTDVAEDWRKEAYEAIKR